MTLNSHRPATITEIFSIPAMIVSVNNLALSCEIVCLCFWLFHLSGLTYLSMLTPIQVTKCLEIAFRLSVDHYSVQVIVYLTSPSGTRSTLLTRRSYDRSNDGFNSWSFMTTHCWGESPNGVWMLEVHNGDSVGKHTVCMQYSIDIGNLSIVFV